MPIADRKFVEAYRAAHSIQAHAIELALEESGIQVVIENEALQDAIGGIPAGWPSSPRLLVEESQVATARTIIRQTDPSEQPGRGLQPHETAIVMSAATLGLAGIAGAALISDSVPVRELAESTRCLACQAVMTESEETCSLCGWTYAQTDAGN